jgi:chorismate mutase
MIKPIIELDELRKRIDAVDALLMGCLAKRQEITKEIAETKKRENMPIFCPEREKQLLEEKKRQGSALDLDPEFITDIFHKILENSRKVQGEAWKLE